ncbi:hypothetical protein O181_001989 [Austropuccinia psidii MF-1]|uniref:Uncharacterized protein n=1 Tax=Austropuccinia psidii MF-1 TaxID=1389203 RepID=A0A9Q3BBK9_9BASI|nr:hypothetical protein [Austropuccinia psidii MF-1]
MPREQALQQPNPGPSGTPWSEDLFHRNQPASPFLIVTFASRKLTLTAFVEPSQHNEPPIPGRSQASEPHEDPSTCEPEPEVAPTQSMEEPSGKSPLQLLYSFQLFLTPPSAISRLSRYTHLRSHHRQYARQIPPP